MTKWDLPQGLKAGLASENRLQYSLHACEEYVSRLPVDA